MVVEYMHFLPSQFNPDVLNYPAIVPIVLRVDSVDKYKRFMSMRDTSTHFKGNASRLIDAAKKYIVMQEIQCEDAKKCGVPVVATDNGEQAQDRFFDKIFGRI